MKIKELMTPNPAFCAPDAKLENVVKLMIEHNCGVIPICENDRIVGVVTDRDIACRGFLQGKNPLDIPVRDIMTKLIFTVAENDSIDAALNAMQEHHVRRLPVTRDGKLAGIISMADLVSFIPTVKLASLVTAVSQPVFELAVPAP